MNLSSIMKSSALQEAEKYAKQHMLRVSNHILQEAFRNPNKYVFLKFKTNKIRLPVYAVRSFHFTDSLVMQSMGLEVFEIDTIDEELLRLKFGLAYMTYLAVAFLKIHDKQDLGEL